VEKVQMLSDRWRSNRWEPLQPAAKIHQSRSSFTDGY
jgi:hypothetical protein